MKKFFSFSLPNIRSARQLALELAKRTRFLKDEVISEEIKEEEKRGTGRILGFYEAFQRYLIRGLTKEEFADLYSQTITYGLFASRMRCKNKFSRRTAFYDIPHTVGILREIFKYISLEDLPPSMEWIIDEIADVLVNVDVERIFTEYFESGKGEDPVFHFYETFLKEYDPEKRERMGVYYTPQAVVSYIVRSLHLILKEKFRMEDGLASASVTILDPAGGTLTFLAEAIRQAVKEFTSRYGEGGKVGFIKDHIIEDFYAFELMIAPYVIGHLKISFLLSNLGYRLKENERMKFFLTNTLELEEIEQTSLPGMASLAEESRKAGEVKKRVPILVVLGNPPYSGISANRGKWITDLIEDYKYVDGVHFGERKHWLQDDYVKFIRFAEWKIEKTGKGVVGFITNHSYLENPTFRGMRQHLMKTFNEICILDLHGGASSGKQIDVKGKDENVFDITKSVAISFFIRNRTNHETESTVLYSEKWGTREEKYKWLFSHDIDSTEWEKVRPESPLYLFIPMKAKDADKYSQYWRITDVFSKYSVGVVTARDSFVIDFDRDALKSRIEMFRNLSITDAAMKSEFGLKDTSTFKLRKSREKLSLDKKWENYFHEILYRPFDIRQIYYTNILVERPLYEFMRHMMEDNIALISARSNKSSKMNHFFCSNSIMEAKCGERTTQSYLFPLYLYSEKGKKANLNDDLVRTLEAKYGESIIPEQVLCYIYAVFYSNIYRSKYMEYLRLDFPRVPFTVDCDLFLKMGKLGKKLLDLHLLKSTEFDRLIAKFQGVGDNTLESRKYEEEEKRVYINEKQYFEGIDADVWEFEIGGYQVLSQWLKYRKGRKLSVQDIKHICKVATALKKTIEIQKEIDNLFPEVERNILKFKDSAQKTDLAKYS
jgi:predicted helicase